MNSLPTFIPVILSSCLTRAFVIPENPNANYFQNDEFQNVIAKRPVSANDYFLRKPVPEKKSEKSAKMLEFNGDEYLYPNYFPNYYQNQQVQNMISKPSISRSSTENDEFFRKPRATSPIPTENDNDQNSGYFLRQDSGLNSVQSSGQSLGQNLIQNYGERSDQMKEGLKFFQHANAGAFLYRIHGLGF